MNSWQQSAVSSLWCAEAFIACQVGYSIHMWHESYSAEDVKFCFFYLQISTSDKVISKQNNVLGFFKTSPFNLKLNLFTSLFIIIAIFGRTIPKPSRMPRHWVVAPMISISLITPINLLKQFDGAAATPRWRLARPCRYTSRRRASDLSLRRYTKRTSAVSYHYHKQIRASLPR